MAEPPGDKEVERMNQAAFNVMMADTSEADRDWVLDYVRGIGVPMTSQVWLPAAMGARFVLELRKTSEEAVRNIQQATKGLNAAAKASADSVKSTIEDPLKRIEDAVQDAIDQVSKTSSQQAVSTAKADLSPSFSAFMNRFKYALIVAAVFGVLLGIFGTHWFDASNQAKAPPLTARSHPKGK